MPYCKFNSRITARLHLLSGFDINLARGVGAAAAILQIWDHGTRIYHLQKMAAAGAEFFVNSAFMLMHLRIACALLIAATCLWFRKALAFYVSGLALVWVMYEYFNWYLNSRSTLKNAGLEHWSSTYPHALNIGGATNWNIAILLLTVVLFAWHIKTLIGALSSNRFSS